MVASTHWLASAAGHGDAGGRRQRVRRGGGDRLRPAGRRAAPQRARRRGADPALRGGGWAGRGDLRPGSVAGRRHGRALRGTRARPRAGHRPAGLLRAGRLRRLDAAAARPRDARGPRRAALRDRLRGGRLPGARADRRHGRRRRELFGTEWPTSGELWLPAARGRGAHDQPGPGGDLPAAGRRGGGGRRLARDPDRRGADALGGRASSPRPSPASWQTRRCSTPAAGATARCCPATTSPPTGRPSRRRSPVPWDGWTVCKTGPWGQGPVLLQQLALLEGFDLSAMAPVEPMSTRCSSARSSRSRTATRGTATARRCRWTTCSATPTPPSAAGWSTPTARRASCARARPAGARRCCRSRCGSRARRARARWASASRRCWRRPSGPATPATSTSPTATATSSRPPRAAAGCRARRRSPGSASRSAAARRCSGSGPRACRAGWRRGGGRGRRLTPSLARARGRRARSPGARRAATSRTSGRCCSSSTTSWTG